jgi:hypothetical protein
MQDEKGRRHKSGDRKQDAGWKMQEAEYRRQEREVLKKLQITSTKPVVSLTNL